MKALIREEEIIVEPFDKWTLEHLKWLTTARPDGDGYQLVQNYVPPVDDTPAQYEEVAVEEEEIVEDDDYVIIDGKKYSKEELRSLLE